MRPLAVMLLLVVASAAGCTSAPATPKASQTSIAPPATVTADTGGIEGLVLDDESRPVVGAEAAILKPANATRTDDSGKFSFSNLESGSYDVVVQKVGYAQMGRKVAVEAGHVAEAKFLLQPVAIIEPYADPYIFKGHIQFGEGLLDLTTQQNGLPGCDKCTFFFDVKPGSEALVTEIQFKGTLPDPRGNEMYFAIYDKDTKLKKNAYWTSGSKYEVPKNWDPKGERLHQFNTCNIDWVCYEETFTSYITVFYNGTPDANFTAQPPP